MQKLPSSHNWKSNTQKIIKENYTSLQENVSENVKMIIIVSSKIPFRKNSYHVESSQ